MPVSSKYELKVRKKGFKHIAGVDEVGRGPLAGPVVAAAVILPKRTPIKGLKDSKRLSPLQREELYREIEKKALAIGVGEVEAKDIDKMNIFQATFQAMREAVKGLKREPDYLLVDGRHTIPQLDIPQKAIVHGDSLCSSIAAASIIAKVTRDRTMEEMDNLFPEYGFAQHKGYGTREHLAALRKYGLCPIHRKTFGSTKSRPKRKRISLSQMELRLE